MGYHHYEIQKAFEVLPKEDREFLLEKHHIEAIKIQIERILDNTHPLAKKLYDWVVSHGGNKKWYLENINSIELVQHGIILYGWQYDIYDIPPIEAKKSQNAGLWSYKQAQSYLENQGKEIPNWRELIGFLPKENWDKFFTDVLGMEGKYIGNSPFHTLGSKNRISLSQKGVSQGKLRGVTNINN